MKKYFGVLAILASFAVQAEITSYTEWSLAGNPDLGQKPAINQLSLVTNATLPGGITTYPNLASFQAAAPITVFEDFENSAVAPGGVIVCNEPVNSLSNGPCFTPGGVVAGFNVIPSGGGGLVTLGAGVIGPLQTSIVIGANTFSETTNVSFDAITTAVSFDVFTNGTGPITITLFDLGGGTIGTISLGAVPTATPVFVAFTSLTPIASINISDDGGLGELLDNLYFGNKGFEAAVQVPTLNPIGIISLMMLMMFMVWRLRKAS